MVWLPVSLLTTCPYFFSHFTQTQRVADNLPHAVYVRQREVLRKSFQDMSVVLNGATRSDQGRLFPARKLGQDWLSIEPIYHVETAWKVLRHKKQQ